MKKYLLLIIVFITVLSVNSQTNISGIINNYAAVNNITVCSNTITVNNASAFSVNDSVLIIQMKGASMDVSNTAAFGDVISLNNAGDYEYNVISSIIGNQITFAYVLAHTYDVAGRIQIVSVPSFTGNVTVNALLTAQAWDGSTGGILIFNVGGALTLNADIDVSGLGFRGGEYTLTPNNCQWFIPSPSDYSFVNGSSSGAPKGEGIIDFIVGMENGRGKQVNGGGGGNDHNTGGAGGGSIGQGGSGGLNAEPSTFGCDGDFAGVGGTGLNILNRIFMAGGGGSGHGNQANPYFAGDGGGIIYIKANSIEANLNNILADGQDGNNGVAVDNDGGSGGGAGGIILLNTTNNSPASIVNLSATGGDGSNTINNGNRCYGGGGGGGGGAIVTSINAINVTSDVNGGLNGILINPDASCAGMTLGATPGNAGLYSSVSAPDLVLNIPFVSSSAIVFPSFADTLFVCENSNDSILVDTLGTGTVANFQWQILNSGNWIDLLADANHANVTTNLLQLNNIDNSLDNNFYRALVYNTCDSVFSDSINLQVDTASIIVVNDTICNNETYTLPGGQMVTTAGNFLDTLLNSNGCDSIITTNLIVYATSSTSVNDTICNNSNYTLPSGLVVNMAGTYFDTIPNSNGCDSVITTNLINNSFITSSDNDTICSNEMFTLPDGQMVNIAGVYLDTIPSLSGCDSIITTNLVVNQTSNVTDNDTICSNEMFTLPDGQMVNTAGIYIDTIPNSNGCDSIVTTNLVVNSSSNATNNDTICSNQMFTLPDGEMINVAGIYTDTIPNSNACDSIVTTNLTVFPGLVINTMPANAAVCEDSSALFYVQTSGLSVTYQWQVNNGAGFMNIPGELNDTLNIPNVTIPINLNGLEFRVLVNSFCGNLVTSDSAVLNIEFNVSLTSSPVDAIICENSDTTFSVTTNGNATNIQWQVDDGTGFVNLFDNANYTGSNLLILNISNAPISFNGNNYRVIVLDNCGVSDTSNLASLTINPIAVITAQSGDINQCVGNDIVFFIAANNAASYQWQINVGGGFINMPGQTNDTLSLNNIAISQNGNEYQCIVSNNCNSITSNIMNLTVSDQAAINSEPQDVVICPEGPGFNFELNFDASNISTYQWQIDTGLGFININDVANFNGSTTETLIVSVPFENIDGANFRLQYTDDCGNGSVSNIYNAVISSPDPVNGINDVTFCQREVELIEVDYNGIGYVWNDGTTGRFLEPTESGDYIVNFLQNSSSCMASDTVNVTLVDCVAECVVNAPTGFSPDGKGFNNTFKAITTCELDFFELIVVDRWGELVFRSNDPNSVWDGTYKNKPAPIATYAWSISYNKKGESKRQSISGNVTLVR